MGITYLTPQAAASTRRRGMLLVLPRDRALVKLQPALWRRDLLMRLLIVAGDADLRDFERRASDWFNDYANLDDLCCQAPVRSEARKTS